MMSNWPLSFVGCIGPILGLLLIAECIRMLWVTLIKPSRPREAACGKCDYPVTGLSDERCPECGASLRIVGVNSPILVLKNRGSLFGAILAWTVLSLCAGMMATGFVAILAYRYAASRPSVGGQIMTSTLYPKSNLYTQVDLVSTTNWNSPSAQQLSAELTLKDGSVWKMFITSSSRIAEIHDPAGNVATMLPFGPSAATLLKWAGLDTTNTSIAAEAVELDSVLKLYMLAPYSAASAMNLQEFTASAPAFKQTGGPASTRPGWVREVFPTLITAGASLLVWSLGIWGIARRRRRLLDSAAA